MQKQTFETSIGGEKLVAEITDLTDSANGSVLLRYGDEDETVVLVTAVMKDDPSNAPFFPLSVEFEERFYAAGAIMGNRFQRREGRPSEDAILSARMIDRTIRPLFDQRIRHDIQIVVTVIAIGKNDPDILGIIGTSLALAISDIPWNGPVGAVRLGLAADDTLYINPNYTERENNKLKIEMVACGQDGTINMIETTSHELSEHEITGLFEQSIAFHAELETWQKQIVAAVGAPKRTLSFPEPSAALGDHYQKNAAAQLRETLFSSQDGKRHLSAFKKEWVMAAKKDLTEADFDEDLAYDFFEEQINEEIHRGALAEKKRADGRQLDEVRPLCAQAGGVSSLLHGSGIFYRGGTHMLSVLTLGGPETAMTIDTIETQHAPEETKKRFLHHYNFPPFSVGETGRVGGFNRRMIGHGVLAEKALLPVIPSLQDFPYTIRLVSETMASNGSSSMGSVCGSTLALMDGGVPITRPVAGIASGVMIDQNDPTHYALLTDIQGPEDEHGDMDFKVAGTREGVTAIQMDVKVGGVSIAILSDALMAAKDARLQILDVIENEIRQPRATLSPHAPQIIALQILPEQIGSVIGSGGKVINGIKEDTGVDEITIEDDGSVFISGKNGSAQKAADTINALTRVFSIGEELEVEIVTITDFGAFAKLNEHQDGLIHISEISDEHVEKASDHLAEGQQVRVKVIKVENGKIGLSIKALQ